jgi:sugar lactone lactonase YvrE/dienelactone hydrolase
MTVGGEADVAADGDHIWIDSYSSNAVGQVDTSTNSVTTTTKVGAPTGIAVGEGAVWVMSLRDGLISRLDPHDGKVVATIPLERASRTFPLASVGPRSGPGVAVGAGAVWVVVPSSGMLVRVDPSTNRTRTFALGGKPVGVAVSDGSVWVIESQPHRVLRVDPSTGGVVVSIKLPSTPYAIATGTRSVWITGIDMVAAIDPSTNGLTDVRTLVAMWATGISEASGKVWVSSAVAPDPDNDYYNPDTQLLAIYPTAIGVGRPPDRIAAELGDLPVTVTRDVPFTPMTTCFPDDCQVMLDVYAPEGARSLPVIVLAHGGPCGLGCRNYLAKQASVLAVDGAVVFNADYRDDSLPGVQERDIACAVNFARSMASDYGGDPDRVMLVGHSNGAFKGIYVAALGGSFHEPCLGTSASSMPDAFVGVAGGRPDPWLVHRLGAEPLPVIRLVIGTNDAKVVGSYPELLDEALRKAGYDSTFTIVEGADHFSVFDPGTASPTFDLIFATMDTLAKR